MCWARRRDRVRSCAGPAPGTCSGWAPCARPRGRARCATLVALSETAVLRGQANVRRGDGRRAEARRRRRRRFYGYPGALPRGEVSTAPEGARARAGARRGAAGARVVTAGDVAPGSSSSGRDAEVFAGARAGDAAGAGISSTKAFWDGSGVASGRARSPPRHRLRAARREALVERGATSRWGPSAPAVFGEECLYAPRRAGAPPGRTPKPGRHAFTVTAARGVGVTVLRLAPGGSAAPRVRRAPDPAARAVPGGASREARALDTPAAPRARARRVASPAFNRFRPPRASAWCSARPRSRRPASSPRKRANRDSRRDPGSSGARAPGWAAAAGGRARRARLAAAPGASSPEVRRTRGSCVVGVGAFAKRSKR